MKRVLVVGSTNIDYISYTQRAPEAGETITGSAFETHFGGKGANQAVMASRCGVPVSIITAIGDDSNGREVLENFRRNEIDTSGLFITSTSTGIAQIWVEANGENRILLVPGANHQITIQEVQEKFLNFSDVGYLLGQLEIPKEITTRIFELARSKGIKTIFNPSPFQTSIHDLIALSDYLIVNEVEFAQIHPQGLAPTSDEIITGFPRSKVLILTLGADGVVVVTEDGSITRLAAEKANAIDTTGAGDALIGALAGALAKGLELFPALKYAISCASVSVTRSGAQSSYPSRDECRDFFLPL